MVITKYSGGVRRRYHAQLRRRNTEIVCWQGYIYFQESINFSVMDFFCTKKLFPEPRRSFLNIKDGVNTSLILTFCSEAWALSRLNGT